MADLRLSVCIAVEDASQELSACLASCSKIAHEIVILDRCGEARVPAMGELPLRVVQVPASGAGAPAQISAQAATGDWLLLLDADEELSGALERKIRQLIDGGRINQFRGFRIRRRRWVYDHPMGSMGLAPDYPERLVRRAQESPEGTAEPPRPRPLGRLEEPIEHFVVRSIDLWLRRRSASVELASERAIEAWQMAFAAPFWFGWEFFIRGGWRDGKAGLTWAGMRATEKFLIAMRSWQRRLPDPDKI